MDDILERAKSVLSEFERLREENKASSMDLYAGNSMAVELGRLMRQPEIMEPEIAVMCDALEAHIGKCKEYIRERWKE